jgi:DNA-binding SARP family transcriptional activator
MFAQRPSAIGVAVIHRLCLTLLGDFQLHVDGQPISLTAASQRIVAFLALRDRPVSRVHMAGVLWSNTSDARAMGSLRTAIWRLGPLRAEILVTERERLALGNRVEPDVRELIATARQVCSQPPDERSISILSCELLPDWYDDWVAAERDLLDELRLAALEQLSDALRANGKLTQAVRAALAAVCADPMRESAHRALVASYLAEGNRAKALRHLRAFRIRLRDELGIEPCEELAALTRECQGAGRIGVTLA